MLSMWSLIIFLALRNRQSPTKRPLIYRHFFLFDFLSQGVSVFFFWTTTREDKYYLKYEQIFQRLMTLVQEEADFKASSLKFLLNEIISFEFWYTLQDVTLWAYKAFSKHLIQFFINKRWTTSYGKYSFFDFLFSLMKENVSAWK